MKIGDKVTVQCRWLDVKEDGRRKKQLVQQEMVTGSVVYIHPQNRFCRVKFSFPGGSFCECFGMRRRA